MKFNLTLPYLTEGPDRNVPLRKSGGRARGSPERMTTLARPSVSLGTFVCYGCRLPRLDSVPRMSEGRSNRSEGQSKCQRPQGFGGFHFGTTFRFPSIPSVNPSASTITIPPSPAPPGPYYFHHISRLQKFPLPSLPYLSDERASMPCSPSSGDHNSEGSAALLFLGSASFNVTYCNLFFTDAPFSCIYAPV